MAVLQIWLRFKDERGEVGATIRNHIESEYVDKLKFGNKVYYKDHKKYN